MIGSRAVITCLRPVVVPPKWRERYLAWIEQGREIRHQHGILAELVCEPSQPGAMQRDFGLSPRVLTARLPVTQARQAVRSVRLPVGAISQIWAKTWSQLIDECETNYGTSRMRAGV